jgi:hypothetical protein
MEKQKKDIAPEQKRAVKIAFNLLFPSLLITGIAIFQSSVTAAVLAICLFIYQSSLIKQFIDTNYGGA